MGIVNITPDSFSDGGLHYESNAAIEKARCHLLEGADILDLGAETTRPGSLPTPEAEEWRRLEPVLSSLVASNSNAPISVDTYKASIAAKAIDAGAAIVNDIYAGRKDPEILSVAAEKGVPIILMHMQGEPRTMQLEPHYKDVVKEVRDFLLERALAAESAGVPKEHIILDPGLGFGKNTDHNLLLLRNLYEVYPTGYISLMALSRKAFLGKLLDGIPPLERDYATATASAIAVFQGAQLVRVHNTAPTLEALKVAWRISQGTLHEWS
jgi:dihydropteroate synthase